jgi:hypothetical protein
VSRECKISRGRGLRRCAMLEHHSNAILHRIVAAATGAMKPCM